MSVCKGRLNLVTAPAEEPVTVDNVKLYARIPYSVEDALVSTWIATARQEIEKHLQRVFITQTWEVWYDKFPSSIFDIPQPPLVSISGIYYYDSEDTEYTFSSDNYYVDNSTQPGRVALNKYEIWPTTILRPINAVKVVFVAGYGGADDVPEYVKDAIYVYCSYRNDNRTGEQGGFPNVFYDIIDRNTMTIY